MTEIKEKNLTISVVIPILMVLTFVFGVLFIQEMSTLNNAYSDMNKIEFISSSTQRLISLTQSNQLNQKDIFFISDSTAKSLEINGSEALSVLSDPTMVLLANEVVESWVSIEEQIQNEEFDVSGIVLSRDAHFKAMTDLSNSISAYTEELNNRIAKYQTIIMLLFFAIAIIMLNNLLRTRAELRISNELAETAQIDVATGLYNRSRCQELFKGNQIVSNKKHPAILVIDLNDLKKTNDSQGHRVGDELIASFASALKDACTVHVVPPFIGRYGGDEFIIYYEDIGGKADINHYLKELSFLTEERNNRESRFKISYAVGYSYTEAENEDKLTVRQLFDRADEAMYENKVAMKRKNTPNYDELVAKGEDVR